ncbi:hypothetical protein [Vibrio parahaemolyticus]|uniref:hypothetical protein n=1 Tax=Vibrio parahaemolyticus TaxID=670 RepID=UPI0004DF1A4F|nr:hypothetical protein [Vibrio parahaemolyticus]
MIKVAHFVLLMVLIFAVLDHREVQSYQKALLELDIEHRVLEIQYLKLQLELIDESAVLTTR